MSYQLKQLDNEKFRKESKIAADNMHRDPAKTYLLNLLNKLHNENFTANYMDGNYITNLVPEDKSVSIDVKGFLSEQPEIEIFYHDREIDKEKRGEIIKTLMQRGYEITDHRGATVGRKKVRNKPVKISVYHYSNKIGFDGDLSEAIKRIEEMEEFMTEK